MPITARVTPLTRESLVAFVAGTTDAVRSATLAKVARAAVEAATEENRRAGIVEPTHTDFVDGRQGAAYESVKPDGVILARFDAGLEGEVVDWVWKEVLAASPILRGRYLKAHVLFADGEEMTAPDPTKRAKEWVITSTAPYARKLEGMGVRQPLSDQAPHGVYQAVAVEASRRFGNIAAVKFSARSVEGGGIAEWASKTKFSAKGHASASRRRDWLTRQPAIVITFR